LFYVLAITLTPLSSATVILQATPIVVVAGAALIFREEVGLRRWAAIILGLMGVVAYSSLMKAMRTGEVSAVTPFRYTRLLFGIAFGVLLFDEQLGTSMLIGCGLIVVSGLFILWSGKKAHP
jgi:drug/metabolite transporter (DMT)-like permease